MRQCARLNQKVRFYSIHPGGVRTEIGDDLSNRMGCWGKILSFIVYGCFGCLFRTPFQGAQTSIYCAVSPDCEDLALSGRYFYDCSAGQIAVKNKSENDLLKMQETLWNLSEQYTSSTLPDLNQ